jgi:glycosyltransferase involved in cell wall biosynthesis
MRNTNKRRESIAFLCPYPYGKAPGQRFRYELFFEDISKKFDYDIFPFLDEDTNSILYQPNKTIQKIVGVSKGFLKRVIDIFSIIRYDYVFIYRECTPIGPPVFEFILSKIFRKKIIYDFDDAIWIPITTAENRIVSIVKWHSKIASICKWSYKISCGNSFLADFAKRYNSNVHVIPTVVDTEKHHKCTKQHIDKKPIVIGWTGTHSTLKYLEGIVPVLQLLEKKSAIEFLVIADKHPQLPLDTLRFVKWNKETEVADLIRIDIGVMPLWDTDMEKGKCGFKAIQYMALGIPAVVSPVGANNEIVENNVNSFLCDTQKNWTETLFALINDTKLREKIGKSARKTIVEQYSVLSAKDDFITLFQ